MFSRERLPNGREMSCTPRGMAHLPPVTGQARHNANGDTPAKSLFAARVGGRLDAEVRRVSAFTSWLFQCSIILKTNGLEISLFLQSI
jgi:hypothetical protein